MNKTLTTIFALAVASAAAVAHAEDVKGDAKAGAGKVAMCLGCHNITGYQASFPEVHKVPKIAGQSATYIVAALNGYRGGDRKHPTMRSIAAPLSDQDIADLAAYYSQLGERSGPAAQPVIEVPKPGEAPAGEPKYLVEPRIAALLKKGNCVACHGANLDTPVDPSQPKLSGQYPDYLYVALKSYKTANNPVIGRNNATMGAQVKGLTPAELRELADFIGSRDGDVRTVQHERFR
jgi:cytochrome c553